VLREQILDEMRRREAGGMATRESLSGLLQGDPGGDVLDVISYLESDRSVHGAGVPRVPGLTARPHV
jgi:hypothetical protein